MQDLKGLKVYNISGEQGIIINTIFKEETYIQDDKISIEVKFNDRIAKYHYPSCVEKYIKFEDTEQQNIALFLFNKNKEQERLDKEQERLYKEEEKRKKEEQELLNTKINKKKEYIKEQKNFYQNKHDKELYPTFLVFQGKSYKDEFNGQYLYVADSYNDKKIPSWDIIEELKFEDIILHCVRHHITAISKVIIPAYDYKNEINETAGLRVDCEYIILNNSLDLKDYRDVIIEHNQQKYSPFNKNGEGNQGYLFPIDYILAKFFIKEIYKYNNEIGKIDYVNKILIEK